MAPSVAVLARARLSRTPAVAAASGGSVLFVGETQFRAVEGVVAAEKCRLPWLGLFRCGHRERLKRN